MHKKKEKIDGFGKFLVGSCINDIDQANNFTHDEIVALQAFFKGREKERRAIQAHNGSVSSIVNNMLSMVLFCVLGAAVCIFADIHQFINDELSILTLNVLIGASVGYCLYIPFALFSQPDNKQVQQNKVTQATQISPPPSSPLEKKQDSLLTHIGNLFMLSDDKDEWLTASQAKDIINDKLGTSYDAQKVGKALRASYECKRESGKKYYQITPKPA